MIASTDQQLDRILNALRDAPPPSGLASRVNARLLQAAESPTRRNPLSAVILTLSLPKGKDPRILLGSPIRIAWAATACAAIIALALLAAHRQTVSTIAEATPSTPVLDTPQTMPAATNPGSSTLGSPRL